MYFRIERDHTESTDSPDSRQGRCYSTQDAPPKAEREYPVVLRCYDDDGELYFTIGCSCDEAAEHAYDWSVADAGCAYSTIAMSRNEKATPFIG